MLFTYVLYLPSTYIVRINIIILKSSYHYVGPSWQGGGEVAGPSNLFPLTVIFKRQTKPEFDLAYIFITLKQLVAKM